MKFMPLVWSNLKRKKARTLLTFLSILVAFVLYGYLAAIGEALTLGLSVAGADRLIVRNRVSIIQPLPLSYRDRIASLPGVEAITHASWFGGIYQDPKNVFGQMAVSPQTYLDMYPEFLLSEPAKERWLRTRTGAIVGRRTAEKYGWKIGDRIPLQATIWPQKNDNPSWEFDLVGIYDGAKDGTDLTNLFFHYDYFDEARQFGQGMVGWYMVRVRNPADAAAVAQHIDETFANSSHETKAETEGAFIRGWTRQIGDITTIMVAIMSAVFFTILLVAGNTMSQSVRERTEELGVLKAMGFTNGRVLGLVLAESCCLAVLGGGLGLAVGWGLISRGDPTGGVLPVFYLPEGRLLMGFALALALGLAAGLPPALQAMRLQIAQGLRRM